MKMPLYIHRGLIKKEDNETLAKTIRKIKQTFKVKQEITKVIKA